MGESGWSILGPILCLDAVFVEEKLAEILSLWHLAFTHMFFFPHSLSHMCPLSLSLPLFLFLSPTSILSFSLTNTHTFKNWQMLYYQKDTKLNASFSLQTHTLHTQYCAEDRESSPYLHQDNDPSHTRSQGAFLIFFLSLTHSLILFLSLARTLTHTLFHSHTLSFTHKQSLVENNEQLLQYPRVLPAVISWLKVTFVFIIQPLLSIDVLSLFCSLYFFNLLFRTHLFISFLSSLCLSHMLSISLLFLPYFFFSLSLSLEKGRKSGTLERKGTFLDPEVKTE